MTTADLDPDADTHFQAFRAPGEKEHILIPVVRHPITNDIYVLWTDITDCFPGVTRIQFRNIFVPMLRNGRLYRYFLSSFILDASLRCELKERKKKKVTNGGVWLYLN